MPAAQARTSSRVEFLRARDPGGRWPGSGYLLAPARLAGLRALLDEVAELTGQPDLVDGTSVADYAAAHDALGRGWESVLAALQARVGHAAAGEAAELVALLRAMKAFDGVLHAEYLQMREAAFTRVREALAGLRRIDETARLVQEAAVAVCSLGFDRAIVSQVVQDRWIAEAVYVGRDAQWAEEILRAGRERPLTITEQMPEAAMLRRGAAILVADVQDTAGVHPPIAYASMSRSYVAAPIIANGTTVGLLHADCYYQQRNLDETDREVLGAFGEGLGFALARSTVLDRLQAIRVDLSSLATGVSGALPPTAWSARSGRMTGSRAGSGAAGHGGGFAGGLGEGENALTRREIEVLGRMAAGDTNARIARRLVISEGTVKTHVKHILRKLVAANRAEAVSRWVQADGRHPPDDSPE